MTEPESAPGTAWSLCAESGCRTTVRDGPRRCSPHEEEHRARGHCFARADLPGDSSAVDRLVHLSTEPPYQRCRHCGGRQFAHAPPARTVGVERSDGS